MGRKERLMQRRGLLLMLVCAVVCLSGCQTVSGLGKGVAYGVATAADGVSKDGRDFWKALNKADAWVKDNLW